MLICCKPACGTVLRIVAGMHYAFEAPALRTSIGNFVRCPKCGTTQPLPHEAIRGSGTTPRQLEGKGADAA